MLPNRIRLPVLVVVFIGLTAAGVYWVLRDSGVGVEELALVFRLPTATVGKLIGLIALLYLTDIWRYQVLGRAVGHRIRFLTALEAGIANDFFSWVTPGAALGAPAAIFVLGKRGVPWEAATLICFGKSMLGSAILLLLTFVCLLFDFSPPIHPAFTALLVWGSGVVSVILIVPILATFRKEQAFALFAKWQTRLSDAPSPGRIAHAALRLIELTRNSINYLHTLRCRGPRWFAAITLIHIPYILTFAGIILVLLVELGATNTSQAAAVSLVYLGFIYVAPTPGASGLSEATALTFFGSLVDPPSAVMVVFLFRCITIYLHLLVGIVYLSIVGGAEEIFARSR